MSDTAQSIPARTICRAVAGCGDWQGPIHSHLVGATPTVARRRTTPRAPEPIDTPRRGGLLHAPELVISAATLALVALGLVMVYSASSAEAAILGSGPADLFLRQALYVAVGLGALWLMLRIRLARLAAWAPWALAAAVAALVVVLIPGIGTRVNGAQRWIDLGLLSIQPSEFAKLALILWLGVAIARRPAMISSFRALVPIAAVLLLLAGLIMLEPDLGTVLVLAGGTMAVLVIAGSPWGLLWRLILAGAAATAVLIALAPYRRERLLAFLSPWDDPGGSGFQTIQAQLAVGSGGATGRGLGEGMQKAFYLPEAHTDMISATIAEELGLIGFIGLIVAFAALAVAGLVICGRCRNLRDRIWAGAITCMIAVQALINLGAALGVLPVTGVPLPLVSYGGSSLVATLALLGLLIRLGRGEGAR